MNTDSGSADGPIGRERRGYKFERLRERIRNAINSGELSGKIPGERELARRFDANAKTISKALNDLTAEGLLVRQVGRGTFVTASVEPVMTRTTGKRFVWGVAADRKEPLGRLLFEQAAEAARADQHQIVLRPLQSSLNGMLSENAITAADLRGYDGLALFGAKPSGELLAELLRMQIGLVLVDVQSEAVRTNCVISDIAGGAFALCEYLIALGHRDIRLAIDSDWLPCAAGAELGAGGGAHDAHPAGLGQNDVTDVFRAAVRKGPLEQGLHRGGVELEGSVRHASFIGACQVTLQGLHVTCGSFNGHE